MNKIRIAGAAAGVVLVSGVVLQVSSAAFTGTTENAGNAWTAGTVTLTDDDEGSALFASTGMVPGDSVENCIEVTYTGDVDLDSLATLEAAVGSSAALAPHLLVTVEVGDADTTCDGSDGILTGLPILGGLGSAGSTTIVSGQALSAFAAEPTPTDVTGWTPTTTDDMRPFRFVVQLDPDTPNDMQGAEATGATFTWTASS